MKRATEELIEELRRNRLPVHPKCCGEGFTDEEKKFLQAEKCKHVSNPNAEGERLCSAYYNPNAKWSMGRCPSCNHYRPDLIVGKVKERVGQQKQKKKK